MARKSARKRYVVCRKKFIGNTIFLLIFFLIGLGLHNFSSTNNRTTQATSFSAENSRKYDFSDINTKIQGWIDKSYYPGASLIVAGENRIIYEKYFGNYTPRTVVYIASSGKWLAAATIAAVVDEGRLSWDDPVSKWLPEFTDSKGKATLRQLLSHTSGYSDYQPKENHRDDYQILTESVAHIRPLTPAFKPGEQFQYGGLAMQVAGRMAELASGMDWESLFQAKIAGPLGMTDTHFTPVDSGPGHAPMLGGGARCTLRDYSRFLSMIYNEGMFEGKRILSKEAVRQMQADQVGNAKVNPGEFVERVRRNMHTGIYGLGEWREILDDKGDAVLISSPSWAGAYPWIDKTFGVYGFFLTHVDVEAADPDGFSAFYTSPVLAMMVRQVIERSKEPADTAIDVNNSND